MLELPDIVTELFEDIILKVPPNDTTGSPPVGTLNVILEFANTEFGTLDKPNAIVPEEVIGEPESTSIPSEPEIATEVTVPDVFVNGKSETKPFLTLLSLAS